MKEKTRLTSPLLLELLLVTLLLALAGVVLVQLLAAAGRISRESRRDTRACLLLQDCCESCRAALLSGDDATPDTLWLDEDFQPVPEGAAVYRVDVALTPTASAGGVYYEILLTAAEAAGDGFATLRAGAYVPEAAA